MQCYCKKKNGRFFFRWKVPKSSKKQNKKQNKQNGPAGAKTEKNRHCGAEHKENCRTAQEKCKIFGPAGKNETFHPSPDPPPQGHNPTPTLILPPYPPSPMQDYGGEMGFFRPPGSNMECCAILFVFSDRLARGEIIASCKIIIGCTKMTLKWHQKDTKMTPIWPKKMTPKWHQKDIENDSKTTLKWNQKWYQNDAKVTPKIIRHEPKTTPKWLQKWHRHDTKMIRRRWGWSESTLSRVWVGLFLDLHTSNPPM